MAISSSVRWETHSFETIGLLMSYHNVSYHQSKLFSDDKLPEIDARLNRLFAILPVLRSNFP
ncbi:MAG: hypothetical protein AB1477_09135 [Acidobacteriota bacterium]